jgi:hypothetical protein
MNKVFSLTLVLVILSLLVPYPANTIARPLQDLTTSLLSPTSCPPGGCAAGQRLNARAEFPVDPQYITGTNTQVCVYTSQEGGNNWADTTVFSISNPSVYMIGELNSICSTNVPSGSVYLGGANATFTSSSNQQFDFAFRIDNHSTTTGSLKISIYQQNSAGTAWIQTEVPTDLTVNVTPANSFSYVASSEASCGIYNPCYLNSGDDLAGGLGTGLKDAIDASPVDGTITILGIYNIKSNSVTLNNPQTLRGINDATLTYSGAVCSNAMLSVTSGATIRDLNINDGVCYALSRDLIAVNSSTNVSILNNDLVTGKDAITIQDNAGNVDVRFNHIVDNSGYGILRASGSGIGIVKAVANNIYDNDGAYQARCNNKGDVNHNFWGLGGSPTTAISTCTNTAGKRLGAAILNNTLSPGVMAETFSVPAIGSKQMSSVGFISIEGTVGVKLVVINHGKDKKQNIPFFTSGSGKLSPCNDFFDVFISDENTVNPSVLNLYLPYDLVSGCEAIIEASPNYFCSSSSSADFPFWWYDPQYAVTSGWDTTGQAPSGPGASGLSGQTTTCDTANHEVIVSIDTISNQRPNLLSDLHFTPFGVGYQNPNILITSFTAIPGIGKVDLSWETSKEQDLVGYYVTRSLDPFGTYNRDSDLIPAKGDIDIGGIYNYTNAGLNNGTTYWYQLEFVSISSPWPNFYGPISAATFSVIPTATEVTPNSVEVYGSSISLKVKGNNFLPSSQVVWDNNLSIDLTTSYINSTELTAILPASLYSAPGSSAVHEITVYNPGSGGGFSPPLTFTIKNPVPTLTSISPEVSDGNSTTISLSIKGDYFVDDSVVRFNGSSSNLTTTFVDRSNLTASILKSNLSAGIITVTVYNPTYGGGTSAGKSFNLYTPTPTLTRQPTSTKTRTVVYTYKTPTRTPVHANTPTRTRTPTRTSTGALVTPTPSATPGLLTPSATLVTPDLTNATQVTPEPPTLTPSLAPGEPTYTPAPPTPVIEDAGTSVWNWRLMSALRVLAGGILGVGLLAFPAFLIFRRRTRQKPPR